MKNFPAALGFAALAILAVSAVSAGPLRDKYMDRAETRRGADSLEQDEGSSGPIALPEGVRVERDIAYGPDAAQRMDVYFPSHPALAPTMCGIRSPWRWCPMGPSRGRWCPRWWSRGTSVASRPGRPQCSRQTSGGGGSGRRPSPW